MFYSTIFAAGVLLDTSSKRRRRMERDKEIEAVKADIRELQDEEARILAELAVRKKSARPHASLFQRRHYSTTAAAIRTPNTYDKYPILLQRPTKASVKPNTTPTNVMKQLELSSQDDKEDISGSQIWWKGDGPEPQDSAERKRALQYLAVKRLALRLLLRPAIAHTYGSIPMDHAIDFNIPKMDVHQLLNAIDVARKRINDIQHNRGARFEDLTRRIAPAERPKSQMERQILEDELKTLFEVYNKGQISLRELLVRVADNLVASEEPIFASTVGVLLKGFCQAKQDDIVLLVIDTLFPARFFLTSSTIGHTINFFSRTKDLYRFNRFLYQLSHRDGLLRHTPWKTKRLDRIDLPVPPNPLNPYLATSLVKAALDFNQAQRARSWLGHFRKAGLKTNPALLIAYLRHCAKTAHWTKGVHFLWDAVVYLRRTKAEDLSAHTERLILHMMTLCKVCGQDYLLKKMIKVAVQYGIDSTLARRVDHWECTSSTLDQWETVRAEKGKALAIPVPEGKTPYSAFANGIAGLVGKEVKACRKEGQEIRQAIAMVKDSNAPDSNRSSKSVPENVSVLQEVKEPNKVENEPKPSDSTERLSQAETSIGWSQQAKQTPTIKTRSLDGSNTQPPEPDSAAPTVQPEVLTKVYYARNTSWNPTPSEPDQPTRRMRPQKSSVSSTKGLSNPSDLPNASGVQ